MCVCGCVGRGGWSSSGCGLVAGWYAVCVWCWGGGYVAQENAATATAVTRQQW